MNFTKTHITKILFFGSFVCGALLATSFGVSAATKATKTAHSSATSLTAAVTAASTAKTAPTPTPQNFTLQSIPASSNTNDFVVGPGKQELTLNPGQSAVIDLTIANRTGKDNSFSLSEEDFVGSDDPTQTVVLLGSDRGPYSLKDYVSIPASVVFVPNNQKIHIPVTIHVPENAQPGGFYGSVLVAVASTQGATSDNANAATASNPIITRIGTLFFVRVPGPVSESGLLTGFSIAGNRSFFFDKQPMNFDLVFKNSGSVYLDPKGTIVITNLLGAPVDSITVDPWFAMPQSTRFREIAWNPPFLFGRYSAHAVIDRGYASTTDEATLVFWVIPWKIILLVIVGLTLLIIMIRWVATHFTIARK